MNLKSGIALSLAFAAGIGVTLAIAQDKVGQVPQPPKHNMPDMPPGMEQMMESCMKAATPGEMHQWLAKSAGTWDGEVSMWMMPGMPESKSTCTTVMTPMMDGRFIKIETAGMMEGMGEFKGFGVYGFDNVSKSFQSVWVDNMGTGMMTGKGELSADKKVLSFNNTFNCPMTGGPKSMREVQTFIDENHSKLEMFGPDMEGKEYKIMEINYTRKAASAGNAR